MSGTATAAPDGSFVADDGRVLMFSCDRFVADICDGDCCFVCGASPNTKTFNNEHIIPDWVLRRYGLHSKMITLPTGARRKYSTYTVPCCADCNSLLGRTVETPISQLFAGGFGSLVEQIRREGPELLFNWLALLFLKTHLKDNRLPLFLNPNNGAGTISDLYDRRDFHHVHEVARTPYTGARWGRHVVGSLHLFEIVEEMLGDEFDYIDLSYAQTLAIRLGEVGIVVVLDDGGAAARAWDHDLRRVTGAISTIQLKEVAAMFAVANEDLIIRPQFGSVVDENGAVNHFANLPVREDLHPYDPEKFGAAFLYVLRELVDKRALEIDGSREPAEVAAFIASGRVRFLLDGKGQLQRDVVRRAD